MPVNTNFLALVCPSPRWEDLSPAEPGYQGWRHGRGFVTYVMADLPAGELVGVSRFYDLMARWDDVAMRWDRRGEKPGAWRELARSPDADVIAKALRTQTIRALRRNPVFSRCLDDLALPEYLDGAYIRGALDEMRTRWAAIG